MAEAIVLLSRGRGDSFGVAVHLLLESGVSSSGMSSIQQCVIRRQIIRQSNWPESLLVRTIEMGIDMMMDSSTIICCQGQGLREKLPDTPSLARPSSQNPFSSFAGKPTV